MFYFASPYLKSRENAVPSFPFFHRRRRLSAKSEHKPNKSLGHKERCHLPWLKMSLKNHRFGEVNFEPLFEFSVLQTRMIPKSLLIKNVRCWLEPDSVFRFDPISATNYSVDPPPPHWSENPGQVECVTEAQVILWINSKPSIDVLELQEISLILGQRHPIEHAVSFWLIKALIP